VWFVNSRIFILSRIKKTKKMRILSIDVGVRTFALCLLEYNESDPLRKKNQRSGLMIQDTQILFWKVLDILKDNGMHAKNSKNVSMPKLIECISSSLDDQVSFLNANQLDISGLDYIVIERQPTGRRASNQKILGLSFCIYTWFHLYLLKQQNTKTRIELFSSRAKGTVGVSLLQDEFIRDDHVEEKTPPDDNTADAKPRKNKAKKNASKFTKQSQAKRYRDRKQKSIDLCKIMLDHLAPTEDNLAFVVFYGWLKKKDDAADACIQGVAFFMQKFVPVLKRKKTKKNKTKNGDRDKNTKDDSIALDDME
jgi:hypothetical protein